MTKEVTKRKRLDWSELRTAAKSLGSRNVILIIIFYACMNYSSYFKNGFRGILLMGNHEISATMYGTMISVFLICGLIMRTPSGMIVDKFRKNIKSIFIIASIIKGSIALLYCYAQSEPMLWFSFIVDGFLWSFVGVLPFALLATFVDRRIVGTAFSLCEGISFIVGSSARALGARVFTLMGAFIPSYISFGIQLLGVLAICFFDNAKLQSQAEEDREEKAKAEITKFPTLGNENKRLFRKFFALFSLTALPFAVFNGAQYIVYQIDSGFLPFYAEKMMFDYLTPATLGGIIMGIIGIVIGIFCDVINPAYFVTFAFAGQMAAPFILSRADTSPVFGAAVMVYYVSNIYYMPLSILAVRNSLNADQGKVQGTMLFFMDFFSIIASVLLGFSIDRKGFPFTFTWLGYLGLVLFVGFILFMLNLRRKSRQGNQLIT